MVSARFIYDTPERNADLFYATRFWAPDPFIFLEVRGKKYAILNDLEIDRARHEAAVDRVLSINPYVERAKRKRRQPGQADVVHEILADRKVKRLVVQRGAPYALVAALKKRRYAIEVGPHPFYPGRFQKSAAERREIERSQRALFAAMRMARDVLARSRIKGRRLVYRGMALTSERLRTMIDVFLLERGYQAGGTIVSCGRHAIDPHDIGAGPLAPHSSIIVDIFPRSLKSGYFGDATRTFCRGRAPEALKRMYFAVKSAQELGMGMARDGINGRRIHEAIHRFFDELGYPTRVRGGRNEGFFHATGHGIGLELHEEPARITHADYVLRKGNVMSVEPGLYYPGVGGVRIEDLVYVTKSGCEVLGSFPKVLEIT